MLNKLIMYTIAWDMQVSKPVAIVEEFARLCNAVATSSFDKNTRAVDFGRLDDTKLKATAFFGYNDDVWRALLNAGTLCAASRLASRSLIRICHTTRCTRHFTHTCVEGRVPC